MPKSLFLPKTLQWPSTCGQVTSLVIVNGNNITKLTVQIRQTNLNMLYSLETLAKIHSFITKKKILRRSQKQSTIKPMYLPAASKKIRLQVFISAAPLRRYLFTKIHKIWEQLSELRVKTLKICILLQILTSRAPSKSSSQTSTPKWSSNSACNS